MELVIVDLSLSQDGSLSWLHTLWRRYRALKIIVLSVHDEQSVRHAAVQAGADAFVRKRAIAEDLMSAVDEIFSRPDLSGPARSTSDFTT